MKAHHGQRDRGEHGAEQGLHGGSQLGRRQGPGIFALIGQDVGNDGLIGRSVGSRSGLQYGDHHVDVPYLVDERQYEHDGGADQMQGHQEQAAGEAIGIGARDRRDRDVDEHLDGQGGAEDRARGGPGEVVGEQSHSDGGQSGAEQAGHLGCEQAQVVMVVER